MILNIDRSIQYCSWNLLISIIIFSWGLVFSLWDFYAQLISLCILFLLHVLGAPSYAVKSNNTSIRIIAIYLSCNQKMVIMRGLKKTNNNTTRAWKKVNNDVLTRKIRLICNDPDATDLSSDDELKLHLTRDRLARFAYH